MNKHRGDTTVEVEGQTYTICYDLNACAKVMDHLEITSFEQLADGVSLSGLGLKDLLYIYWCGFNRNHPDLSLEDIGAMEWDLSEMALKVGEAFRRGLLREVPPEGGGEEAAGPTSPGTGKKPS